MKKILCLILVLLLVLGALSGCSEAAKVNANLSKDAD